MALLAKLAWKLTSDSDALWSQILRAKYLPGQSFFQHVWKPGSSFVWRGLLNARRWIMKGACFQLGNGSNIKVWSDPWIPSLDGKIPRPREGLIQSRINSVADLKYEDGVGWNEDLVRNMFTEDSAIGILSMREPNDGFVDKLIWRGNKAGGFSVGSCFEANTSDTQMEVSSLWGKIWKSNLHARFKMFFWRALSGVLPSRDVITRRIGGDASCSTCRAEEEMLFHIFKECPAARALAFGCNWGLKLDGWRVNSIDEIIESC